MIEKIATLIGGTVEGGETGIRMEFARNTENGTSAAILHIHDVDGDEAAVILNRDDIAVMHMVMSKYLDATSS